MSKKAIYYDEAKRLFVTQGFGLTAIEGMLDGKVTRRQLYNWKRDGQWDKKRKAYLESQEDLSTMVKEIVHTCAKNALENPTPKNLLALSRALSAAKENDAISLLTPNPNEDGTDENQDIQAAVALAIKDIMGA